MENDLHIRKIDLAGLLRQCINERKTAFIRNGVFPKLQVETSKTHVESDEKWLRFTVHQLISNALKYTKSENGKSHLVLSVRSERQTVLLEIRDDGIGIPPEDLPRIFEPFFTGENGRRTKEASGMGLYLVKQALNRLGHRIEAHSRPGEGTRFVIRFAGSSITRLEDDTMNLAKL